MIRALAEAAGVTFGGLAFLAFLAAMCSPFILAGWA